MSANKELDKYIPIARLIAKTFGSRCEVVLHDLSVPKRSVIYAANNNVTGRQVGQSFDHLIKQVLLSRSLEDDCRANYVTTTEDGRLIKSSTALLRDADGKVIGALCLNYDLANLQETKRLLDEFLSVDEEKPQVNVEPFDNVVEILDDLIDKIIDRENTAALKKQDKMELVAFMEKKGVFLIKGAVEKVAERLSISKVTVYSYLDKIKKNG
jgi:predicted transcriptional regulator YheO